MSFKEKVILVTGAARGIGREYCHQLAALGAAVMAVDINACDETVEFIKNAGGRVLAAKVDVTNPASIEAAVAAAEGAFGRLDGLVNNAALYGSLRGGRFDAIPEKDWDAAMAVNVRGIWNCCKAAVPALRRAGGGSIVNIASLAATYGLPYALHYTTSKAAVIGLTRGLARELGREGIRVNSISPSAVLTEGTREFFGAKAEKVLATVAAGQAIPRNLEAADVAGSVIWLLSDDSRFTTGQNIAVDGGTVMH
jgi:NAD(P)-dependent dehydrogenase (short-subunit alcohol dehydrogenase family)